MECSEDVSRVSREWEQTGLMVPKGKKHWQVCARFIGGKKQREDTELLAHWGLWGRGGKMEGTSEEQGNRQIVVERAGAEQRARWKVWEASLV